MKRFNKWVLIWAITILTISFQIVFYYSLSKELNIKHIETPDKTASIIKKNQYQLSNLPQSIPTQIVKNPENNSIEESIPTFPSYEETLNKDNIVTNPNSSLVLINKERYLPDGFVPSQLIMPSVPFSTEYSEEKRFMKAVAALALEKLFESAKSDGYTLYAVSGYRSYARQSQLFQSYVEKSGQEAANMYSAKPGSSEHQTGLSMDITSKSNNFNLSESFGKTQEGKWVKENAHKFGFIIRYPEDKVDSTLYVYEPWHIRYVGITEATYIFENNLSLEEVMQKKTPKT